MGVHFQSVQKFAYENIKIIKEFYSNLYAGELVNEPVGGT